MESYVRSTGDSERRKQRILKLYDAINVVLRPLQDCELTSFVVNTRGMVECKCVRLLGSYSRDIPAAKNMSSVAHVVASRDRLLHVWCVEMI